MMVARSTKSDRHERTAENIVNKSIGESAVREFDVIGTSCFVLSAQNLKPEVTGIESRYAAG